MKPQTIRTAGLLGGLVIVTATTLAGNFNEKNVDGWSGTEIAILSTLRLSELAPPPKDPSNAYEALPSAASLGLRIFFDRRFSRNGTVSCASCHQPEKQFQDGRPLGLGMSTGARRTMPVVSAGYSPFLFWDGRKDSLWSQALGPLEDPAEHGGNRLAYAHLLAAHYRAELNFLSGDDHTMTSAFKTPSLRNVALRAPYMHAGQIASLADVVRHYASAPQETEGHSEFKPFGL